VSLAFSSDGKYVAAQGGAPDWSLSVWLWEKSKLMGSSRADVAARAVQCSVQPGEDPALAAAVGPGSLRVFRIEGGLKVQPLGSTLAKREAAAQDYTCHAWLLDHDARALMVRRAPPGWLVGPLRQGRHVVALGSTLGCKRTGGAVLATGSAEELVARRAMVWPSAQASVRRWSAPGAARPWSWPTGT
jgi:hypothetical protein